MLEGRECHCRDCVVHCQLILYVACLRHDFRSQARLLGNLSSSCVYNSVSAILYSYSVLCGYRVKDHSVVGWINATTTSP